MKSTCVCSTVQTLICEGVWLLIIQFETMTNSNQKTKETADYYLIKKDYL